MLAATPEPNSTEAALAALVRPEFRLDIYVAAPGDKVLFGPTCTVLGCERPGKARVVQGERLCNGHWRRWTLADEPPATNCPSAKGTGT